jgi:hypothetical protein
MNKTVVPPRSWRLVGNTAAEQVTSGVISAVEDKSGPFGNSHPSTLSSPGPAELNSS